MKKIAMMVIISIFMLVFAASCSSAQATPAPTFTLSDMNGKSVSLKDYQGQKAVLLFFTNPRIGGGQDPLLRGYLDYYQRNDKLQLITIVDMSEPGDLVSGSQKRLVDLGYSTLRDEDGSVTKAFNANSAKLTLVLVDKAGTIRFRQEVTSTADTNTELAQQVDKLTQ